MIGHMLDDDRSAAVRRLLVTGTAACLVMAAGFGSASCVLVQPHERKYLSMPEMTPATDALEDTFHAHIQAARNAATNGHGGGGGGCGCG